MCISPLPPTCVPHASLISFFLIWWHEQYLGRSTDHEVPQYVISSNPLLPRLS
jgi:hypothetical protein